MTESTARPVLSIMAGAFAYLLSGVPATGAMVGGVAGSAILALVFAPSAFVFLTRLSHKKRKLADGLRRAAGKAKGLPGLAEQA